MDFKMMKKRIDDWFNSPEGKESVETFRKKLEKDNRVLSHRINKIHKKDYDFIRKVIEKYESDSYVNRWYRRGKEPECMLYWLLYECAKKYGTPCTEKEWEKYSDMFTTDLIIYKKHIFKRMDGQGTVIKIFKK